jgi:hypothetical protein
LLWLIISIQTFKISKNSFKISKNNTENCKKAEILP